MQQVLQRGAALAQQADGRSAGRVWDDLHAFLACAEHRAFGARPKCLA